MMTGPIAGQTSPNSSRNASKTASAQCCFGVVIVVLLLLVG